MLSTYSLPLIDGGLSLKRSVIFLWQHANCSVIYRSWTLSLHVCVGMNAETSTNLFDCLTN